MKHKKIAALLLTAILAAPITGCSEKSAPAPGGQNQAVPVQKTDTRTHVMTAPLTGLPVDNAVPNRIVMVMVNNFSKARPQSGLGQADIVYEMLEEGLITRFMAFYQSHSPDIVGPVRSIRPYNIEIGQSFDAIMAHAGGSVAALSTLREGEYADMDEIYVYPKAYWRDKTRKAPHNLYTSIGRLRQGAANKGYAETGNVPVFHFKNESDDVQGEPGTKINISYSKKNTAGYEYDPATKQYKRFTAGKPHVDRETGKQLTATNVLVIAAKHRTLDSEGRLEIDTHGPGEGYLFQRGKAMKITWEQRDGAVRAYQNGEEMPLYPGTTWINVVPTTPSFSDHLAFE
jgi:hypothetical protein